MPKIRKSRRDKKLSDQRKNSSVATVKQSQTVAEKLDVAVKLTKSEHDRPTQVATPVAAISTSGYTYLFSDLAKTAILTSSIIIAELVIKYYIK